MPRRRPGTLRDEQRARQRPRRLDLPAPDRIHGLSARTSRAIHRYEALPAIPASCRRTRLALARLELAARYRNFGHLGEQLSRPVDGSRTDPAVIGVYVDVAAAHDGAYVSVGEAVTVFEDGRDTERGRRFDAEAGVVEEHRHTGDDRRLLDQDGIVSEQEEVVQDGRDGTPAGDAVSDGVGGVALRQFPRALVRLRRLNASAPTWCYGRYRPGPSAARHLEMRASMPSSRKSRPIRKVWSASRWAASRTTVASAGNRPVAKVRSR